MNSQAENIIRKKDGFTVDARGYCCAALSSETARLQKLIQDSIQPFTASDDSVGSGMTLSRRYSDRPFTVIVSPLRTNSSGLIQSPRAVLFISDPEQTKELPSKQLTRIYGTSPEEAELVAALIKGATLSEIADARAVREDTVRKQLKSIFRKTNTRSQLELVKLILTGPVAMLGADDPVS
jgi:DNA-binding NarL/FixJ family response regulator